MALHEDIAVVESEIRNYEDLIRAHSEDENVNVSKLYECKLAESEEQLAELKEMMKRLNEPK